MLCVTFYAVMVTMGVVFDGSYVYDPSDHQVYFFLLCWLSTFSWLLYGVVVVC